MGMQVIKIAHDFVCHNRLFEFRVYNPVSVEIDDVILVLELVVFEQFTQFDHDIHDLALIGDPLLQFRSEFFCYCVPSHLAGQ